MECFQLSTKGTMSRFTGRILSRYRRAKFKFKGAIERVVVSGSIIIILVTIGLAIVEEESRTIPTDSHELRSLLREASAENRRRVRLVADTCKDNYLGSYGQPEIEPLWKHPPAPQYTVLYIDEAHNISYCPIYKAGSTTWLYNLCLLNGISENELDGGRQQISTIARKVLPGMEFPEADEAIKKSANLLVVRHPFERLLSAYRDKLENSVAGREHGTLHFYEKYGTKIVRKYRDEKVSPPRPDQVIRKKGVPPPAGIEPTWREFVQYLIDTDLASYGDDHWMPYYLFCAPCIVKFDLIAKVETLWRDQIFAIYELGLENKISPRWRHRNSDKSNAAKVYFSQLSPGMVARLYDKFKLDFQMFDYSPVWPVNYYEYTTSDGS